MIATVSGAFANGTKAYHDFEDITLAKACCQGNLKWFILHLFIQTVFVSKQNRRDAFRAQQMV